MLQTKRTGWLTNVQKHKKIALLLLGMFCVGCQQPTKQSDVKKSAKTKNSKTVQEKKTETISKKTPEKGAAAHKKQQGNNAKQGNNEQKAAQQNTSQNSKETGGIVTYAGLPIAATLSRSSEQLDERKVSEHTIDETDPELNAKGIPVKYIKKNITYRMSAAFDENLSLDPEKASIYPGAVLVGSSIDKDGTYREITNGKKRKAVYSFSLQGAKNKNGNAGVITGEFVPSLAAFRNFHNEVLSQKIGYAASISSSYEEMEIKSKSAFDAQFKIGVGFGAAGLKAKIGSGFKFKSGDEKTRYLIRFTETFYTVDINQDNQPLMTDIPKDVLGQYMPVYVSSVSYGRIAYLSIESDKTWQEIKPHIEAVLKVSPGEANADASTAIEKLTQMTSTNIVIIGGGSEGATTLAEFRKSIVKGGFSSGNPGQVIKYKLRFLDDNAPAYIKYDDSYDAVEQTPVTGKITLTGQLKSIYSKVLDFGNSAEIFGTITMKSHLSPNSKAHLFNYGYDHVLDVPHNIHKDVVQEAKTITLPNTTGLVNIDFKIQERNYKLAGGNRSFYIKKEGQTTQKRTDQPIKVPEKQSTHTFTLVDEKNPNATIDFTIEFKRNYLFN